MAWTDQCKFEACNQVEHKMKEEGVSKRQAIIALSKESEIPQKTLERWAYEPDELPQNRGTEPSTGAPDPKPPKVHNGSVCPGYLLKISGSMALE